MTRTELLTALADNINELTRPRHTSETYVITELTKKGTRKRVRKRHTATLPSLLDALYATLIPSAAGGMFTGTGGIGFESESAADPAALAVLDTIRRGTDHWTALLQTANPAAGLANRIQALVGAPATTDQLEHLSHDAAGWVAAARVATGYDPPPVTIDQPCPYCFRKNTLTISGDLMSARCSRCRTTWDHNTIGLLGQMLTANAQTTLTET